jgi:hypothetical protein
MASSLERTGASRLETSGDGIPFFEKLDRDIALHLAEVKAYKSGMVELRYEVRGHRGESRNAT